MFYASEGTDGVVLVGYSSAITSVVTLFIVLGLILGAIMFILELIYEFRRTYYIPIRERMREEAYKNRAQNILNALKGKKGEKLEDDIDDAHDGEIPQDIIQEEQDASSASDLPKDHV
jgi:hypothetical protein